MNTTQKKTTVRPRPVWHVYYGTRGAAGAYVDALLGASHRAGLHAEAFVSTRYAYRTPGAHRWFFPLTDRTERRNRLILLLRAAELGAGLAGIALLALLRRPEINIHLIGPVTFLYAFFCVCRAAGLRTWVTCHDVLPHSGTPEARRLRMFRRADRLIVHSPAAREKLMALLGPQIEERIRLHPFPFSPYDALLSPERMDQADRRFRDLLGHSPFFLLCGVVRRSKGVEVLLDAWAKAACAATHKLVIAGKWDEHDDLLTRARATPGCILMEQYLTEEELVWLIEHAHFSVLPYLDYTHSGILWSVAHHGGAVIVSDIELFKELLPEYDLVVPRGDATALAAALDRAATMSAEEVALRRLQLQRAAQEEARRLVCGVASAYRELLAAG
jgi:glycosyltransferase involved in cell wall biosynthesis